MEYHCIQRCPPHFWRLRLLLTLGVEVGCGWGLARLLGIGIHKKIVPDHNESKVRWHGNSL